MSEQSSAAKWTSRLTKAHFIVLAVILILSAAWYVILGDTKLLFVSTILFCLWGFSKKSGKNIVLLIFATAMVLWLGLGTAPLIINSHTLWKYPFQSVYVSLWGYDEPEYFPDFKGDVKGGYEFDYMPSVMQGTGHYSVYFETDESALKKYSDEFSAQAKYTFTLEEYYSAENASGRNIELPQGTERESGELSRISLFLGKDYYNNASADVTVYVLYSNLDFNHPHTSAVFIDNEKNAVFLSQLG